MSDLPPEVRDGLGLLVERLTRLAVEEAVAPYRAELRLLRESLGVRGRREA